MTHTIGVLGSGSWGTALAVHLARTGHDVRLWARDAALAAQLAATRTNAPYLPGIDLPSSLTPTHSKMRPLSSLMGTPRVSICRHAPSTRRIRKLVTYNPPEAKAPLKSLATRARSSG